MTRQPRGWAPRDLPALPAGEAPREWPVEIWGAAATYPPSTAPGFQAAWRMGILPPPAPEAPPAPVPGLSSWDRVRLGLALGFGAFGLAIALGNALDLGALTLLLAGVPFLAGVGLFSSTPGRDEVEFAAGYTSMSGNTGLWRLARDGRVLRAPDRRVPPPGWYPSPYFPGILQRWDGPGWKPLPQRWWRSEASYFRTPEQPFI